MEKQKKAVFFFCCSGPDPVAPRVYQAAQKLLALRDTGISMDDRPILRHIDSHGNLFDFVQTNKVLSHDFTRYLPVINQYFSDYDFAGIITWHAGQNAPDAILTVHSTGDVATGTFGLANPSTMRNLLLSLEKHRVAAGLDGFRVTTEATHWSGIVYEGGGPELILQFPVPLVDVEIGSSPDYWGHEAAAETLARSLPDAFSTDGRTIKNLLCAGGVHFESAFANAVFHTWEGQAFGISHILANQWLVAGAYEGKESMDKLEDCIQAIQGGIAGIAFHDNLKGVYKDQFRTLAARHGVPVFKHQLLRRPEDIPGL